jgi:nucleotide-binding universal stress UspA family protein
VLPVAVHEMRAGQGSKLYVVAVVPDIFAGVDWRYAIRGETGGSEEFNQKALIDQARGRLKEVIDEAVPRDIPAEAIVKHGTPYQVVVDAAADLDVDLIVVAAHRPSLKDYLIGPTSARVVRHADCSVYVVRPHKDA